MGLQRFYVAQLPISGRVDLDEGEARHANSVLRLKENEEVLAFDGIGGEAHCHIVASTKKIVTLQISERLDRDCELSRELHVGVALPKGDRQKTLIDSLVQIGVTSLCPLIAQRGVAQPNASALARLNRSVIESSKQCGRNRLMQIREPQPISKFTERELSAVHQEANALRLFAHPYGDVTPLRKVACAGRAGSKTFLLIGPEGGFTDDEADQLRQSGWLAISLGPRILRVEVASAYAAGWLAEMCCSDR